MSIKIWTGSEVRELRQRLGLSQEAFAQRLGVHFTTINRLENNRTEASPLVRGALDKLDKTAPY